jgi:hypothetical protein
MLTYEALIEQTKVRNMPSDKIRGILREYLQILLLKQLYRIESGRTLYFTGGTYLRLVHNLKRFSEDLDFNSNRISPGEFNGLCKGLGVELKRLGLKSDVSFAHWDHILVARFNFPDVERFYGIVSKYSRKKGLLIKLEVNQPNWKVQAETEVISGYGETYPCVCTEKSQFFADKIDALVKKGMARHLYDIIFMLSNRFPVNSKLMKYFGYREDPFAIIMDCVGKFKGSILKKKAEALRPFLFDEGDADLIVNAPVIVKKLIQKYER